MQKRPRNCAAPVLFLTMLGLALIPAGMALAGDTGSAVSVKPDTVLIPVPSERVRLEFGHQRAGRRSLLFEGSRDWGMSASAKLETINSELSLFGMHGAETRSPDEGFTISGSSEYYAGGQWRSHQALPGTMLSAGYVTGREVRTDRFADGVYSEPVGHGAGYSLGLESRWLEDRLRVELDRAITRFTHRTDSVEPEVDDAYSASLVYRPELAMAPPGWRIGVESQQVDADFHSPANDSLASNRTLNRVFTRFSHADRWSLTYSHQQRSREASTAPWIQGNEIAASMNLALSDRWRITPRARVERETNRTQQISARRTLLSLTTTSWLIPERLFWRHRIRFDRRQGSVVSPHGSGRESRYVSGQLKWRPLESGVFRKALDVNLDFSVEDVHEGGAGNGGLDDYRIQLSVNSQLY